MNKVSVLLFGVTSNKKALNWPQISETVKNLKNNHDNLYIKLVIFQDEPFDKRYKDATLELVDDYYFRNKAFDFQMDMMGHISKLKKLGQPGQRILVMSCCYDLKEYDFWDLPLVLCCDSKRFLEGKNRRLNHRFMYGRPHLIENIWRKKQFVKTITYDENLFFNTKNIIGESKIPEYTFTTEELTITRAGWGVE